METTKTTHFTCTCQSKSFISIFFTCQVSAHELQPFSLQDLANVIYLQTAKIVFSHLKSMLDEMCEDGKEKMKEPPADQIGSCSRAVTCCDGCRGHFSQNCTFMIKNYIIGALLYYGHLCMRKADLFVMRNSGRGHPSQLRGISVKCYGPKPKKRD